MQPLLRLQGGCAGAQRLPAAGLEPQPGHEPSGQVLSPARLSWGGPDGTLTSPGLSAGLSAAQAGDAHTLRGAGPGLSGGPWRWVGVQGGPPPLTSQGSAA